RSDRSLCRLRTVDGEASEERDPEDLCGFPERHAHHPSRDNQRRLAGLPESLTPTARTPSHLRVGRQLRPEHRDPSEAVVRLQAQESTGKAPELESNLNWFVIVRYSCFRSSPV